MFSLPIISLRILKSVDFPEEPWDMKKKAFSALVDVVRQ